MNDLRALTMLRLLWRRRREPSCEKMLLSALWTFALMATGLVCCVSVALGGYLHLAKQSPEATVPSAGVDTLSREQLSEAAKTFDARGDAYQELLRGGIEGRDPSVPLR